MKKFIPLFSLLVFVAISSCNNEPEVTKKAVIVVPSIVGKKEEPKPTSVTVDKSGVQVETKKITVKVKPNK
jgi:hypothetical protein